MTEIVLKTNEPEKATGILFEALETEAQNASNCRGYDKCYFS